MNELLKEGDVFKLTKNHKVYTEIPKCLAYTNKRGDWTLTEECVLVKSFPYLVGTYVVKSTAMMGGGHSHDGGYPDGHRVYAVDVDDDIEINFYQSGCFTAMIKPEHIEKIGEAKMKWVYDES